MSCWRVLRLCEQPDNQHLLVKPVFSPDSYIVHLSDLSNVWSEELSLDDIVDRASQEQSPIEVSKQDTAQLGVLLENIAKPLSNADDALCRITRNGQDGIILHAAITLPEPLGRLSWKFQLQKRTSTVLKNELILPLLVSSHIQNERIVSLIKTITSKDKAINRLLDQFESSNLDLAAAFPGAGSMKTGRRMIKREQAAKHVPALKPFYETVWRKETGQLEDLELTSLGLFQEALAQSTSIVPQQLKSDNLEASWWTSVPTHLTLSKAPANSKTRKSGVLPNRRDASESSEEETEDEFDTHEHFKDESDSTEEELDLDTPAISCNPTQVQDSLQSQHRKPSLYERLSSPPTIASPAKKANDDSFRTGGEPQGTLPSSSPSPFIPDEEAGSDDVLTTREAAPPSPKQADIASTPKKSRKPFRIGGKGRAAEDGASQRAATTSPSKVRTRATQSPTAEPPSSPLPHSVTREMTPAEDEVEETPEEKAERRRAELKRRNEEAAKKQAQQKKKKRF
ncbi:LOW QUALITY PROTEIN: XRCC4-like factor-domain-containing protein [Bipolaris maydis]|nr:LOW QUALITY PROTEIN: XRCC4-like factor-domain-containing protein [Bipolaris maydis]